MAKTVKTTKANKKADKDSGLEDQLESEVQAPDPEVTDTGATTTVDPTFADGAMEVDSKPWNPPEEK